MATIATHSGNSVALRHNQRFPEYVKGESHIREDGRWWGWEPGHENGVCWTDETEVYDWLFADACDAYAAECKRRGHPERSKTPEDVLEAQRKHNRPAIRELVCGVYPADDEVISEETEEKILIAFAKRFMERFPSMRVTGVYFHADEQGKAPHIHLDYVPVAERQSRGLPMSPSMKGALRDMGYTDKVAGKTVRAHALTAWTADVNHMLEDVCAEHGVTVTHPDRDKDIVHLDTAAYKAVQDAQKAAESRAREIETEAEKKAVKALSKVERRQNLVEAREQAVEERERDGVTEAFQQAMSTVTEQQNAAYAMASARLVTRYFRETYADDSKLIEALDVMDERLEDTACDESCMRDFKTWWQSHVRQFIATVRDVMATMVETVTGYRPRPTVTGYRPRPFAAGGIGVDNGSNKSDGMSLG